MSPDPDKWPTAEDMSTLIREQFGVPADDYDVINHTPTHDEIDSRDVEWWNPNSPDFEREYADESEENE